MTHNWNPVQAVKECLNRRFSVYWLSISGFVNLVSQLNTVEVYLVYFFLNSCICHCCAQTVSSSLSQLSSVHSVDTSELFSHGWLVSAWSHLMKMWWDQTVEILSILRCYVWCRAFLFIVCCTLSSYFVCFQLLHLSVFAHQWTHFQVEASLI